MTATSVSITVAALQELGKIKSKVGNDDCQRRHHR